MVSYLSCIQYYQFMHLHAKKNNDCERIALEQLSMSFHLLEKIYLFFFGYLTFDRKQEAQGPYLSPEYNTTVKGP